MSLIFSCGFSRVAVKESFHKPGSTIKETDPVQRWRNYQEMFGESSRSSQPIFAVDKTTYMKKGRVIYDLFRKMNSRSRTEYLKHFSLANWNCLPESQKLEHTMSHCQACQVHHFAVQTLFPNTIKFKPQALVQRTLVENGNAGTRK